MMNVKRKKNVITTLLIYALICPMPLIAQDGFDRFDGPADFSDDVPPPQSFDPPPSGDGEEYEGGDFEEGTVGDSATPSSSSNKPGVTSSGSEGKFFGRNAPTAPKKDQTKYVDLNPETGFGPEVVESFDFPDTDILELTKHMQKLTGINLILDKDVKGKVSISAPTPITVGDAWKAYLAALTMAGYTLVKTGSFYRIIPLREIRYTPTKIYMGEYTPETENFVTKIIPLKYASAKEIEKNYRTFNTRYGRIIALEQTNTILIQDTGTNIKRLEQLVKSVDAPGFEESLQIIKVKFTSAQEIAKLLDNILQDSKNSRNGDRGARFRSSTTSTVGPSISRIIAEPRTNSIIVMANQSGKKQLEGLMSMLDVPNISKGSNRIQVYYLQYGDAESLSKTLTALISNAQAQQTAALNAINNANNSRFSAGGGGREARSLIPETIFDEEVKVTSDKATNSIVVTASPTDWITVKDVIKKLDVPRDQVFVEGLILETNVSKGTQFGINYASATGTSAFSKAGIIDNQGPPSFADLLSNNAFGLSGIFAGIGFGKKVEFKNGTETYQINSVNALIKAVSTAANTNVIATPQILVMDNSEGTFEAGETVPITSSTVGSGGQTSFSTSQQKIVLSLKIKPQINKETRFIKLNITQKIEDFSNRAATSPQSGGAATVYRNAETEVVIKDRDTIAMGGLMRDKEEVTDQKVPLLGDIPVLGWLFKSRKKLTSKVNLIFFLTPRIISPYEPLAGKHTKEVLEERQKHLGKYVDPKDVFSEKVSELTDKVNKQINRSSSTGSTETATLLEDENKTLPEGNGQVQKDELASPNYQEIESTVQ